jgi:hypothetical protein
MPETNETELIFEPSAQEITALDAGSAAAPDASVDQILNNLVTEMALSGEQQATGFFELFLGSDFVSALIQKSIVLADCLNSTAIL